MRKRLAVPGGRRETVSEDPRRAAISGVSLGAIVCKSRMLWRRVEPNVVQFDRREQRVNDFERLDGAIQVLIIDGIFIMVHTGGWACHFVSHEENTIVAWIGLDRGAHRRASPRFNGRLFSYSFSYGLKTKGLVDSRYAVLTVRSVVIHVALVRMTLAPCVFVRYDVLRLSKIRRSRV